MKRTLHTAAVAVIALALCVLAAPALTRAQATVLNYFAQADSTGDNALYLTGTWSVDGTAVTSSGAELNIVDGVLATAAEINRAADASTRLIAGGSSLTLTELAHDGKIIKLDTAAGTTITLPAATGSGAVFRFVITTVATSNSHIIKVANATDTMQGLVLVCPDDAATGPVIWFKASGTDDTITLNRTTTGSTLLGEWIEVEDVASGKFSVRGVTAATGTEATPFSATVS